MIQRARRWGLTALLLGSAAGVQAHFPILECKASADASVLSCLASYSDGSVSGEVELRVFSYDEALLETFNTDAEGAVAMPMPSGEFYIVFDPGHESAAEFDYAELE